MLREEGGFEFKKAIIDTILLIIKELPDTTETGKKRREREEKDR
jgi:hypothetical protein